MKAKKKKWSGKAKGSAFELHVVKEIRKAVSKEFAEDICYRTPRSGGHPIIGGADIIIKPRLRKIFNFAVECKHRKTIRTDKFFELHKDMKDFLKQTLENTYEGDDYPLLVLRGNRTPVFCASSQTSFINSGYEIMMDPEIPGLIFKYRKKIWKLCLFKFLMIELKNKIRNLQS